MPFGGDGAHDVPHLPAAARIKAGGGLIEKQQFAGDNEAGRDVESTPHAAGIGARLSAGSLVEFKAGQQLPGALTRGAP